MENETKRQRHSWRLHPSLALEQVGVVEHYYEKQAAKGLVLESVGGWLDCFVRTAPCAMRYRAEPVLRGEQDGPDWDRQQFYKDAGWQYLGTAGDLHFFASAADSGAEELHTDPQDFAPAIRRQRRGNFWYSLIFSVVMLAVTPLIFLDYPPEPRGWFFLVILLLCVLVMLPGLIRDGRWLFQKRWQHLPPVDHKAKVPRGITLRARPLSTLVIIVVVVLTNFTETRVEQFGFIPVEQASPGQLVLTLAETDGTDLVDYNYPLPYRENNTCRAMFAPAGYWFYQSDESAKTPDGAIVQLSVERASCRSEGMAAWVFDRMLDHYDWMKDKTTLTVPGFDELLRWGREPGVPAGWYFARVGNQAVFLYYEGSMEEDALLALLAERLEAAT